MAESQPNDIFKLLGNLVDEVSGKDTPQPLRSNILRHVSDYVAQLPTVGDVGLPIGEATLLAQINKKLEIKSEQFFEGEKPLESFTRLYGEIKNSNLDGDFRRNLLTFMLLMLGNFNNVPIHSNQNMEQLTKLMNTLANMNVNNTDRVNNDSKLMNGASALSKVICGDGISIQNGAHSNATSNLTNFSSNRSKTLELNEANYDLVKNVVFSFGGIEGEYLKKDVITGKFKINSSLKNLTKVQIGMLERLSQMGYYYENVLRFMCETSGYSPLGQMGQGFIAELRREVSAYLGIVALLHEQLAQEYKAREAQAAGEHDLQFKNSDRLTLLKLTIWADEPLHRFQWLSKICEAVQSKKGGEIATIIYGYLINGSPIVCALVKKLLIATCRPLLKMLESWLLFGDFNDRLSEFFIERVEDVGEERLWHDKYRLRLNQLPGFISTDLANKILVAGKSINFIRHICKEQQPVKGGEELKQCFETKPEDIFAFVPDTKLHTTIDNIYQHTAKRVLDIMVGKYRLLEHLKAMRRYLLLGAGDFINILMENLKTELDKPAHNLYAHDLSAILDSALRATNATHDDPEILYHLDLRVLTAYGGEVGWDIISLIYSVTGPLATMLEPSMNVYQKLFKPLWRMQHMEFVLSSIIWKDQKCNAKLLRPMEPELGSVSHRLHLFTSEIMHFVYQMQYYILFEVIECNWVKMLEECENAATLDDILEAHSKFLENIKRGAFVDSTASVTPIYMEHCYDNILLLESWQRKFYEICFAELEARKAYQKRIKESEKTGTFGITAEEQFERDHQRKVYQQLLIAQENKLKHISIDYEKAIRNFLLALNSDEDPNLQQFGVRLDFNEYYKKRDTRLHVPLTFEHMQMRISNVHNSTSRSMIAGRPTVN